jgi:hypothetical protein
MSGDKGLEKRGGKNEYLYSISSRSKSPRLTLSGNFHGAFS